MDGAHIRRRPNVDKCTITRQSIKKKPGRKKEKEEERIRGTDVPLARFISSSCFSPVSQTALRSSAKPGKRSRLQLLGVKLTAIPVVRPRRKTVSNCNANAINNAREDQSPTTVATVLGPAARSACRPTNRGAEMSPQRHQRIRLLNLAPAICLVGSSTHWPIMS